MRIRDPDRISPARQPLPSLNPKRTKRTNKWLPGQARGFSISSAKFRSRGQSTKRRMRRVSGVMTSRRASGGGNQFPFRSSSSSLKLILDPGSWTGGWTVERGDRQQDRSVSGIAGTRSAPNRSLAASPSLGLGPGKPELVLACISKVI